LFSLQASALEVEPADGSEVWLVTYGPGEVYWQRFGHNAIWVRDGQLGLDHTFNFGFFDFEQEQFFLRFLMGRMLYFSAAQEAAVEFDQYVAENREIRVQRLDLSPEQAEALIRDLLADIRPENRDYLYDYYTNNCSTRVRDALDDALGGAIRKEFETVRATGTWRDHTRRLTQMDSWLYLGLETALGRRVDKKISRWDEMFIPGVLSDALASGESMVLDDRILFESSAEPPPDTPGTIWPRYLLASLGLLAVAWMASRRLSAVAMARAWFVTLGALGLVVLFLWFGTDHRVAGLNLNILVFCPLWLLFLYGKTGPSWGPQAVVMFSVLALAAAVSPVQYTADVAAAFLPVSLAAAWVLHRAAEP
jgi:hypothetical protein